MSSTFASGRHALGTCDMCAGVFKLKELRWEISNQRRTGFRVCSECLDKDNPQLQLGKTPIDDPQALRDARPDTNVMVSRGLFGWDPTGNPSTTSYCYAGTVTVS